MLIIDMNYRLIFQSPSVVAMINHLMGHSAIDADILSCNESGFISLLKLWYKISEKFWKFIQKRYICKKYLHKI